MSSIEEQIELLENDLLAKPMRISAYHDLPFAIFHYPPKEEFAMRKQMALLATRLGNAGKRVKFVSLGRLFWQAIAETEGIDALATAEKQFGFKRVQESVATILSDPDFAPLPDLIVAQTAELDPEDSIVFLVRVGVLGPAFYRTAKLLEALHGKTMIPIVLFYPGTLEGPNNLRFLDLPEQEVSGTYSYRVKIY